MGLAVPRLGRPTPRKERNEAAPSLGPVREGLFEERPLGSESIDVGARLPIVTMGSQVIGSERIDRDQEDAPAAARPDRAFGTRTSGVWLGAGTPEQNKGESRERCSTELFPHLSGQPTALCLGTLVARRATPIRLR